jgi:ribosomal protein S18 acetylase RimI-like enzyme
LVPSPPVAAAASAPLAILPVPEDDVEFREWMAAAMATTDPWVTLGRGLDACRAAVASQPGATLFAASQPRVVAASGPGAGLPAPGDLVGGLLLRWKGMAGAPYIAALVVGPGARGCGVGSALVARAEAEAVASGAKALFLCVSDFNLGAQRLYVGWRGLQCWLTMGVERLGGGGCLSHVRGRLGWSLREQEASTFPCCASCGRVPAGTAAWGLHPWATCRTTSSPAQQRSSC